MGNTHGQHGGGGRRHHSSGDSGEQVPSFPGGGTGRHPSISDHGGFGDLGDVRFRASSISQTQPHADKVPMVFKWKYPAKEVYISGSFDNWKTKLPLAKEDDSYFYTIVDLNEGRHEYKFFVDGTWQHDAKMLTVANNQGSLNNVVTVKRSDFEVFDALAVDSDSTSGGGNKSGPKSGEGSPKGSYGKLAPSRARLSDRQSTPPVLPPHLLQVILNKDIPVDIEPTLLPQPNHVMLNHLYALSIKDGVMVLSATHRYRKKYVTTLLYKPI